MELEIISLLSADDASESLLARDRMRERMVVIERTHPHDEIWNPVTDESLQRTRSRFAEHKQLVDRLRSPFGSAARPGEAGTCDRVSDGVILAVYDTGIADGRVFAIKEYVDGPNLETWADGRPPDAIVRACIHAARASESAHAVGLCQLAPSASRIFVAHDGRPRVHAFGSLLPSGSHRDTGAPWNRAPESFDPASTGFHDPLTEQWGYAALIWELVYGTPPVSRGDYIGLVEAIRRGERDEPRASAAPPSLRPVLDRAMTVDRSARFESMSDFLDALSVVISHT